jgi:ketosteroid isomerase-like protein
MTQKTELFLHERVGAYFDAFNRMDLDATMSYFAPNALYEPGDGCEYHGVAAVRRAFEPQFSYARGKMYFEEEDRIVDDRIG